jgi:AcrR family transcriptional regulator
VVRADGARRSKRPEAPEGALPTREVILDTAERLFALHGVDGVAVRDLAREMNLTAPSLYNHFPSKQALYDAVLERGLQPIIELIAHSWTPGGLKPESIRQTLDRLLNHLAQHPHLARLLQRAMLEESGTARDFIDRWLGPLYRGGVHVIRETAAEAGWESDEFPHLALGLFGMVFAYFTNTTAFASIAPGVDPLATRTLTIQRRVLEKSIYRLLGPQTAARKKA